MGINKNHISGEFLIRRFANGVKLLKPEKYEKVPYPSEHTLDSLMSFPFPVYLENPSHISIRSNEATAKACGFSSLKDFIGKPPFKYFKKDTVTEKIANHAKVIKSETFMIAEETAKLKDCEMLHTLSIRMPWYDDNNHVIGLFGCSIVIGVDPLARSLKDIAALGLLDSKTIKQNMGTEIDAVYLSKRELDCLRLTILGKPAKQVAYELQLSQRTVEEYLDNIKRKMNVSSKAALIEKTVEYYFSALPLMARHGS